MRLSVWGGGGRGVKLQGWGNGKQKEMGGGGLEMGSEGGDARKLGGGGGVIKL